MPIAEQYWFEVWYVRGVDIEPAYLVVVTPDLANPKDVLVRDITSQEVLYRGRDYDDVTNWLSEDGFSPILGREFPIMTASD